MDLQPETSREDIQEIISKIGSLFHTKKRLTRLLVGESQLVHVETEQILEKFLGLILEVEEEPKRLKGEDLCDDFKSYDIISNEIIFSITSVDTSTKQDPIIIRDDETVSLEVNLTSTGKEDAEKAQQ